MPLAPRPMDAGAVVLCLGCSFLVLLWVALLGLTVALVLCLLLAGVASCVFLLLWAVLAVCCCRVFSCVLFLRCNTQVCTVLLF